MDSIVMKQTRDPMKPGVSPKSLKYSKPAVLLWHKKNKEEADKNGKTGIQTPGQPNYKAGRTGS